MKHMSISEYARRFDAAKTRRARLALWLRSLPLRYQLWAIGRQEAQR